MLVVDGGEERFHGTLVTEVAERMCRCIANEPFLVVQGVYKGLNGPRIAEVAERLSCQCSVHSCSYRLAWL